MDDSESNTRTEIDFVEVAERKDRADDPMHASGKFRDGHNGTNVLTDVQRLWLHHPASSSLPRHGRIPIPKIGTPLVYTASRYMSCRDVITVMSGNTLTNQTPRIAPGSVRRAGAVVAARPAKIALSGAVTGAVSAGCVVWCVLGCHGCGSGWAMMERSRGRTGQAGRDWVAAPGGQAAAPHGNVNNEQARKRLPAAAG
jgi:hypothetical protein